MIQQVFLVFSSAVLCVIVVLLIMVGQQQDEQDNKKPRTRVLNQPVPCQFCQNYVYFPSWFGRDWVCSKCWEEYGLDDRVCSPPKKIPWVIAEIEIEELECDENDNL